MNNLRTKRKIEYDGFVFKREQGHYRRGTTTVENPERWLHRYVYHKFKGTIPQGYVIHHIDHKKDNNDISNLRLMKTEDHISLHAKEKKTDNSYLDEKVELRLDSLKKIKKQNIRVLEAFAGDGFIWKKVKEQTNKKIQILRIDMKADKEGIYLKGNNLKYLKKIDLSIYDIIDLDAYGSPVKQLEILFEKKYKGIIHCTFIQTGMGRLDNKMLLKLGYSKEMIQKIPTIFSKNGMQKMEDYLWLNGIRKLSGFFINNKNYFWFTLVK